MEQPREYADEAAPEAEAQPEPQEPASRIPPSHATSAVAVADRRALVGNVARKYPSIASAYEIIGAAPGDVHAALRADIREYITKRAASGTEIRPDVCAVSLGLPDGTADAPGIGLWTPYGEWTVYILQASARGTVLCVVRAGSRSQRTNEEPIFALRDRMPQLGWAIEQVPADVISELR